ncbi:alpha/beta hydrolase [Nocardioides anomalus]|uniref:Alpha/beta hydrolase n=1 Tax=Nocardioides anomalus TaxID=2712223 RepID=A0A6G6WCN2_9ACTN|nr:alpha/beta hydrolase [Nocardioides anomalus]QIG43002.1 alpha/beta hydrolase [Nocardioides anomalus]
MTTHAVADDGTRLAFHLLDGPGEPLLCLPGGPMLDAAYFRDLGGLASHRALALLDPRGTGGSDRADPATYRCDRQVPDVEAVRRHLGLDRLALLGHSAGANLAYRYAERHPDRVERLLLVAPSPRGLGVAVPDDARSAVAASRSAEPWYADAAAALARVQAGSEDPADERAVAPFTHGRWDDETRAYDRWMDGRRIAEAWDFVAEGALDPDATRAALRALDADVLVLAGSVDVGNPVVAMAEVAAAFPRGRLVVQEGAGHFSWVDDPEAFVALVAPFVS